MSALCSSEQEGTLQNFPVCTDSFEKLVSTKRNYCCCLVACCLAFAVRAYKIVNVEK